MYSYWLLSHFVSSLMLFCSIVSFMKAVNAVYNVDTFQRAADIKEMLKQDSIYKKGSSNNSIQASMLILTKILKKWNKIGQQQNQTRLLLCNAFLAQYSNTEIALQIRCYAFRSQHFNESNRANVRSKNTHWMSYLVALPDTTFLLQGLQI